MEKTLEAFHGMWDEFPGMARLIDRKHRVIAVNPAAAANGFEPGCICAQVGDPAIHRKCKLAKMFETGEAQTDAFIPGRIRGWMPVSGEPGLCVHFALPIPREQEFSEK